MDSFSPLLASREVVLDGGLATELEARGFDLRDSLWSARLLRDAPEAVEAAHQTFFEAGADVAITASYHATLEGFAEHGLDPVDGARLLRLSVELAERARDRVGDGLVAGSIGPYCVLWADGTEYTGDYSRCRDEDIERTQRARMHELLVAGADLLAFETVPSGREAAVLGELLDELPGVPCWVTFCCRDGDHLSDGTPIADAAREVAGRATAVGVNCCPPQHVESLLGHLRGVTDGPLVVYPNHGRVWDGASYTWRGPAVDVFPETDIRRWRELGAQAIGGCCGIGPDGIAALAKVKSER